MTRDSLGVVGVQVNLADDMWPEMWRKFITICVLSGVGAVSRVTWGEIVDSPRTWALCVQCVAEAVAIANAKGMSFDEEFLKSAVDYFKNMPSDLTASLTRDVMAGKPSELEAQVTNDTCGDRVDESAVAVRTEGIKPLCFPVIAAGGDGAACGGSGCCGSCLHDNIRSAVAPGAACKGFSHLMC